MAWNDYFELKWTSSLPENMAGGVPTNITRRFRMQLIDAQHASRKNLNGFNTNLLGQLMIVRVAFRPRHVLGLVRIDEDEAPLNPAGTLRDLEEAAAAYDLEAKLWTDDAFWSAAWLQDWTPAHYDPLGEFWYVPMELRQRQ